MFQITKLTWCKAVNDPKRPPRTLPVTPIGGHACCDSDLCNKNLTIQLWDYRDPDHIVPFDESGAS